MSSAKTVAAIVAAAIATVGIGHAADADKVSFSFDRSALQTAQSTAKLYVKLERTAKRNCFSASRMTLSERAFAEKCKMILLTDFVDQIDNRRLTAMHEDRHGASRVATASRAERFR